MTAFDALALTIGLRLIIWSTEFVPYGRALIDFLSAYPVHCSIQTLSFGCTSLYSSVEVTLHKSQVSYTRIRFIHFGDIRLIFIGDWIVIQLSEKINRYPAKRVFDQNTCFSFRTR